jgi:hypothetical protein
MNERRGGEENARGERRGKEEKKKKSGMFA